MWSVYGASDRTAQCPHTVRMLSMTFTHSLARGDTLGSGAPPLSAVEGAGGRMEMREAAGSASIDPV